MTKVVPFSPISEPVNYTIGENLLTMRLEKILNYFLEFDEQLHDVSLYKLWSELNEISGRRGNSPRVSLLATCAATEICKNFANICSQNSNQKIPADGSFLWNVSFNRKNLLFLALYERVIRELEDIDPKSENYKLKFHLFQTWTTHGLFRLDTFHCNRRSPYAEKLFIEMFYTLQKLDKISKDLDGTRDFIKSAAQQLINSSNGVVDFRVVLKIILTPLIEHPSSNTPFSKKCLPYLTKEHCRALSAAVARRILLNEKCDFLQGAEMKVIEKVIPNVRHASAFDSLIYVITKSILNSFHPEYENILKILAIFITRCTRNKAGKWEKLSLNTRKRIQLMVSRFQKVLTREGVQLYPRLLVAFFDNLLVNAPSIDITFKYLDILQFYIRRYNGTMKLKIVEIFEKHINRLESGQKSSV